MSWCFKWIKCIVFSYFYLIYKCFRHVHIDQSKWATTLCIQLLSINYINLLKITLFSHFKSALQKAWRNGLCVCEVKSPRREHNAHETRGDSPRRSAVCKAPKQCYITSWNVPMLTHSCTSVACRRVSEVKVLNKVGTHSIHRGHFSPIALKEVLRNYTRLY